MNKSIERPLSVSIISWFFMLWAFISAVPKVLLFADPEAYALAQDLNESILKQSILHIPFWFQLAHAFAGIPVVFVAGFFMLRGHFWALVIFIFWLSGTVALTFAVSGPSGTLYAKLIVALLLAFILTRRKPLKYFKLRA